MAWAAALKWGALAALGLAAVAVAASLWSLDRMDLFPEGGPCLLTSMSHASATWRQEGLPAVPGSTAGPDGAPVAEPGWPGPSRLERIQWEPGSGHSPVLWATFGNGTARLGIADQGLPPDSSGDDPALLEAFLTAWSDLDAAERNATVERWRTTPVGASYYNRQTNASLGVDLARFEETHGPLRPSFVHERLADGGWTIQWSVQRVALSIESEGQRGSVVYAVGGDEVRIELLPEGGRGAPATRSELRQAAREAFQEHGLPEPSFDAFTFSSCRRD